MTAAATVRLLADVTGHLPARKTCIFRFLIGLRPVKTRVLDLKRVAKKGGYFGTFGPLGAHMEPAFRGPRRVHPCRTVESFEQKCPENYIFSATLVGCRSLGLVPLGGSRNDHFSGAERRVLGPFLPEIDTFLTLGTSFSGPKVKNVKITPPDLKWLKSFVFYLLIYHGNAVLHFSQKCQKRDSVSNQQVKHAGFMTFLTRGVKNHVFCSKSPILLEITVFAQNHRFDSKSRNSG